MARYNDFDEPEGDGVFDQILTIVGERKREFAIASVTAAVILLGLIVWGSYPGSEDEAGDSVPIVRADAGHYKTTPDNPGGMEIPYRDSTVFSAGEQAEGETTENILAEDTTEQPVPRSQLFAGLNTEGQPVISEEPMDLTANAPAGEVEDTQAQLAKAAPVESPSNDDLVKEAIGTTPADSGTTTAQAPAPAEAPAEEELASAAIVAPEPAKPAPAKPKADKQAEAAAKTEPAAGAASAPKVTPGGYYIQVGSVRSESGADGEWKKIQAKYSSQLGGLKYRTQEANLGAKGVFYRIQAGPMSKESADGICGKIKAQSPGACLVTK